MRINGIEMGNYLGFVYDGCHKIYMISNEEERCEAEEYGYKNLYSIDELIECLISTCPLRFIQTWTFDDIILQGAEEIVIEDYDFEMKSDYEYTSFFDLYNFEKDGNKVIFKCKEI